MSSVSQTHICGTMTLCNHLRWLHRSFGSACIWACDTKARSHTRSSWCQGSEPGARGVCRWVFWTWTSAAHRCHACWAWRATTSTPPPRCGARLIEAYLPAVHEQRSAACSCSLFSNAHACLRKVSWASCALASCFPCLAQKRSNHQRRLSAFSATTICMQLPQGGVRGGQPEHHVHRLHAFHLLQNCAANTR